MALYFCEKYISMKYSGAPDPGLLDPTGSGLDPEMLDQARSGSSIIYFT